MDSCIQNIFDRFEALIDLVDDRPSSSSAADHGETLDEHECWFDHHGTYDNTLHVPLVIRYPGKMPEGVRVYGYTGSSISIPPLLESRQDPEDQGRSSFDGQSLVPLAKGEIETHDPEIYFTECTWMRKHGWRTPEWKLIVALEPDFHFKPPVELYNACSTDPDGAQGGTSRKSRPDVVAFLRGRMDATWIAKREARRRA